MTAFGAQASASHHDIGAVIEAQRHESLRGLNGRGDDIGISSSVKSHELNLIRDVFHFMEYPVIQEIKDLMEANGALKAMMSGSGPTVFGIFDDRSKLREAAEALRDSHLAKTVFATQIYNKK